MGGGSYLMHAELMAILFLGAAIVLGCVASRQADEIVRLRDKLRRLGL